MKGGDIRLGTGHDVVHPRHAIGRLGAWPVEGKAQLLQPGERLGGLVQESPPQRAVVAGLNLRLGELAGVLVVVLRIVLNIGPRKRIDLTGLRSSQGKRKRIFVAAPINSTPINLSGTARNIA